MSKRFNNKRLLYLLGGLLLILFLTVIIKIPKEKATLKSKLIDIDTSEVSQIILYPKVSNGNAVEFRKNNGKWTVQQGTISDVTHKGAVQNIFNEVLGIKPQSLAANDRSKWEEYELTDSLSTRIKFLSGKGKVLVDLLIGKFNYKQVNNPYGGYGGSNVQITSFVRLYDEKEIYAVDGMLPFAINRSFDEWRDKTFIVSNHDNITKISFNFPADSSYNLIRKDSVWYAGNQKADSSTVADYLNTLGFMEGQTFKDNFKPVLNPDYRMIVEGNNLLNFSVNCYYGDNSGEYILNSSLNPDGYFASKENEIFGKLFKPKNYFVKKQTTQ